MELPPDHLLAPMLRYEWWPEPPERPVAEEASPPPLAEEASPPPLAEEASPPPLVAEASPPTLAPPLAEEAPPPTSVEEPLALAIRLEAAAEERFFSGLMRAIQNRDWVEAWRWAQWVSEEEVCMASPPTATPPLHTALHMAAWTTTKEPPSWVGEFYDMLCVKAQGHNLKGPSPRKPDFFPIGDRPVLHGILVLTSTGPPFLRRASRLHLSGARLRLSCFRGEGCPGSSAFSRRIRPPESKYRRWGIGARYGCPAPSVSGGCFSGNLAQGRAVIDARNARGLTALHSACSWATSRWSSRSFELVPVRPRLCWPAVRPLILRT